MECKPLKSFTELLEWTETASCNYDVKKDRQTMALFQSDGKRVQAAQNAPRLMVCHDMKGGYTEDRFYDGCNVASAYTFYHWSTIDEFVYFSHHLVTIPPCGWIQAAHANGVPIYGTFITEGSSGHSTCLKLLRSEQAADSAVNQLVAISRHYGVDGWLVDIQNRLQPNQVNVLRHFLARLRSAMHEAIPHSRIIWYDSVTKDGRVAFQNKLNEENEEFFGLCDGIFLNYWWKSESMLSSKTRAGNRVRDVYVGIDVFGRGTRDGGGFNVVQPVAESRWFGLSAALFAPGWTHEAVDQHHGAADLAEDVFWSRLTSLVGVHGPTSLPLTTNFSQGRGLQRYASGGKVLDSSSWHCLAAQQLQPSFLQRQVPPAQKLLDAHGRPADATFRLSAPAALGLPPYDAEPEKMLGRVIEQSRIELLCSDGLKPVQPDWEVYHTTEDAFDGGGCLRITNGSGEDGLFRLFACDLTLGPDQVEIAINYAVKATDTVSKNCAICLDLEETTRQGISRRILEPSTALEVTAGLMDSCARLQRSTPRTQPQFTMWNAMTSSIASDSEWEERCYQVPFGGNDQACRLVSIGVYLTAGSSVLLGEVALKPGYSNRQS